MKYIGAHVSAAGGVYKVPQNAHAIGATAAALFTRNQRQWSAKPYDAETPEQFKQALEAAHISPAMCMPHSSYLINVGSPDAETRRKSIRALTDELQRVELLSLHMLNFHPGSSLGKIDVSECIGLIADGMEEVFSETDRARLILETTAGQGSTIGARFEEIAQIIDRLSTASKRRVGVCIDTCHALAAGYDVASPSGWALTMDAFDRIIGLERLAGLHLNDSKFPRGSRKDRHDSLGQGYVGWRGFAAILGDPRTDNMPLILETPRPAIWSHEIARLRALGGPGVDSRGLASERLSRVETAGAAAISYPCRSRGRHRASPACTIPCSRTWSARPALGRR
ncbi:MAG: deoxyribonuclease IV [Spirochaetes bacterium]|jgi:deoxyribonuclease-4|nr:deoxyribonuclease IV [Spirochaetota bacterium]